MWALQWQLNSASLLECIRRVGSSMTTGGMWGLPIPAQFQTALLWVFRRQRHLAVHFSLSSLHPPPRLYYSKVFHEFTTVFPLTKFFLLPQNHAQPGTWGKFSATLTICITSKNKSMSFFTAKIKRSSFLCTGFCSYLKKSWCEILLC